MGWCDGQEVNPHPLQLMSSFGANEEFNQTFSAPLLADLHLLALYRYDQWANPLGGLTARH